MTMPTGYGMNVRSILAGLTVGLALLPGCGPADSTTEAPPNPAPRADLGVTVAPRVPKDVPDHDPNAPSSVEKDLRKDLGGPVLKPDATTTIPPAGKPDAVGTGTP